jgi:hypothetical protein
MWVQRRLLEVSLMVTWDGSNGLISARPGRRILVCDCTGLLGDPALPTTGRYGGDVSVSGASFWMANALCFTAKEQTVKIDSHYKFLMQQHLAYRFRTYKRQNVYMLRCDMLTWSLLPCKHNSMFTFSVVSTDVAVNNKKVFSDAMTM